ncbi:MAG: radical SAM protein [Ignavibacteriae bacterium]|nr:radical SAM protein [Ignavibacteriota bacterium]NOG97104.1 radical SAM protein [Ignavibacteriota bacterium]
MEYSKASTTFVQEIKQRLNNSSENNLTEVQQIENFIAKKEYDKAGNLAIQLLDQNSNNQKVLELLAETKFLQGDILEAEMLFENVLKNSEKKSAALKYLIEINIEKHSLSVALNYFIEFLMLEPYDEQSKIYSEFFATNLKGDLQKRFYSFMNFNEMVPTTFTIETALACDLKCPECAIGGGMINSRAKGFMKFDQFKEIFDKIKPSCEYLYLHLWGEPMLNKEIFKIISYASQFTRTNISTNAQSLDNNKIEKLITSGVSDLIVSIDGYSQEVYEKYRVGGDVKQALKSLHKLASVNTKYGNKVQITPQFIVFEHNEHEVESFEKYCSSIGLKPLFKAPYIRSNNSEFSFSSNTNYRRKQYEDEVSLKTAMADCVNAKEVFTINLDGSVIVCCHDYDKATNFGNIFEEDLTTIWNKSDYRKYRWKIIDGQASSFCIDNCMTYTKALEEPEVQKKEVKISNKPERQKEVNLSKVNLCSGPRKLNDYVNIDITPNSDIVLDLEKSLLPFEDNSVETLVCISAINYFTRARALEIIKDVFRTLTDGGVARFGVQDLRLLTKKYLDKDEQFFFEKLEDGSNRFPSDTLADKFNEWFYGFPSSGKHCKYVYDFESLAFLFKKAGFKKVEQKQYRESEIENIELIDNRPEQLFFLEAVKECKEDFDKSKIKISSSNDWSNEKNWQALLEKLEENISDKKSLVKAAQLMINTNKWSYLIKMLNKYLSANANDEEIRRLLNKAERKLKEEEPTQQQILQNQKESLKLNKLNGSVRSDEFHLRKAIDWILTAFDAAGGKGISANYNLIDKKWNMAYPETTGYIIPTLIEFSKQTNDYSIIDKAIQMADWAIAIQWNNGGIGEPVGVFGRKPIIFNTSQVILGFLSCYDLTSDIKYLNAAIKAGDWITGSQEKDGSWKENTYKGPQSYHIRTAWSLLELFKVSNDQKYSNAAHNNLKYTLSLAEENGFINNTSLEYPEKSWTHFIGYTLVGLLEIYRLIDDKESKLKLMSVLINAAENLIEYYNQNRERQSYPCFPGTFDNNWRSTDNWSCISGNAQLEFFLRRMHIQTKYPQYLACADKVLDDLKHLQILDIAENDKNLYGSFTGSYPVEGQYRKYNIPNWGVKFFADSLIQKIYKVNKYLG